jgi:hypothetical protein
MSKPVYTAMTFKANGKVVERMSGRIEPNDVALEREGAKQDDRARNLESDRDKSSQEHALTRYSQLESSDLSPTIALGVSSIESIHNQARAQESIGRTWEKEKKERKKVRRGVASTCF